MPWIIPVIGAIAGAVGIGTSIKNSATASNAAGIQNQVAQSQEQINAQRMADQQKVFDQVFPFFSKYLDKGSPFLSNIQSQTASQNAQQYNNAAGNVRQTMQTSGTGYGPSGATGAALGELGAQEANQSASSYLQNLLNNENVKFQAAQGLTSAGQGVAGVDQRMPTNQVTQTTTGSSIGAFGDLLKQLLNQSGSANNNGTIPLTPPNTSNTTPIMPGPSPTQGINL